MSKKQHCLKLNKRELDAVLHAITICESDYPDQGHGLSRGAKVMLRDLEKVTFKIYDLKTRLDNKDSFTSK